ncbi:hypothetical protein [Verrucomicrobium sp. BvORR034]|uniref:hypothetical protein n=1 Tax=Verrucomicrobium sp. BvORR034 TaxID=1396418 RepID=UPI000679D04A|nr:hypothetical protein [Verrucomicrobium sp. BvORR034]
MNQPELYGFTCFEPGYFFDKAVAGGRDDAVLWVDERTGRLVGYVTDAPEDVPTAILGVIRNAFVTAAQRLIQGPGGGAKVAADLMTSVNRDVAAYAGDRGARDKMVACLTCVYRDYDGLYVACLGDTSAVLLYQDGSAARVTVTELNDRHGDRFIERKNELVESYWGRRVGSLEIAYPEQAVSRFAANARAICLFTDGIEKHYPDFERLLVQVNGFAQLNQGLSSSGRIPTDAPDKLEDDICVLYHELPPLNKEAGLLVIAQGPGGARTGRKDEAMGDASQKQPAPASPQLSKETVEELRKSLLQEGQSRGKVLEGRIKGVEEKLQQLRQDSVTHLDRVFDELTKLQMQRADSAHAGRIERPRQTSARKGKWVPNWLARMIGSPKLDNLQDYIESSPASHQEPPSGVDAERLLNLEASVETLREGQKQIVDALEKLPQKQKSAVGPGTFVAMALGGVLLFYGPLILVYSDMTSKSEEAAEKQSRLEREILAVRQNLQGAREGKQPDKTGATDKGAASGSSEPDDAGISGPPDVTKAAAGAADKKEPKAGTPGGQPTLAMPNQKWEGLCQWRKCPELKWTRLTRNGRSSELNSERK